MSVWLALRFVKFVALAVFFAGIVGTFRAGSADERRRWADRHAAPGFVLLWFCGLGLVSTTGQPLFSRWILGAVACSLLSIWTVLAQAHLLQSKSKALSAAASLGFVTALALMVWRP
ncbi:MAG: hypothetical protein JNM69_35180 [Archangium sp.]|nr:hypothetical protein [Archangium sp.]